MLEKRGLTSAFFFIHFFVVGMMDFESRLNELRAFLAQKNIYEATRLARLLVQQYPKRAAGYNALTSIYAETKDAEKAWIAGQTAFDLFPHDINANLNYASLLVERDRAEDAIQILNVINQKNPNPKIFFRMAQLELSTGEFNNAVRDFSSGLDLNPHNRQGWLELVTALTAAGRHQEVLHKCDAFQKLFGFALEIECNKGLALFNTGCLNDANLVFQAVLKHDPRYAPALLNNGAVLQELGDFDGAIDLFKRCIEVDQFCVEAYINLTDSFAEKGLKEDAIEVLREASNAGLGRYEIFYRLGNLLHETGNFEAASDAYKKGIEEGGVEPDIYNNLAVTLRYLGDLEGARKCLYTSLQLNNSYAQAHYNLSLVLWACNEFPQAFRHYEYRFSAIEGIGRAFTSTKPIWNGSSRGKVFVWREQGLGDEIFFCSSLVDLRDAVAGLIVEVDHRLVTLLKRSFPNDITFISNRSELGSNSFDSHISLGSQFGMFRHQISYFNKSARGYLVPDEQIVRSINEILNRSCSGLRVGISWSTKSIQSFAHYREVGLIEFAQALNAPHIQMINLQYGDVTSELNKLAESEGITVVSLNEIDISNDMESLAALISNMDLVVSIDNVTVNLAGALGVNTMVLLPFTPDPRWSVCGDQSYAYRSVKMYRQSARGEWMDVLSRLRVDILGWSKQGKSD